MCSIGEGDFGDEGAAHTMPASEAVENTLDLSQICKKCNLQHVVLKLDAKEPQCRSCFLAYVHHKFRASLGSTKVLPRDASVLLVVDGTAKSIVLLDMCRFALQQDQFRKLRFSPKILFIDERPLVDSSVSDRVIEIIKSYNFESFYHSLGSFVDPVPVNVKLDPARFAQDRLKFMESFDCLESLTSKQDFLQQFKKRLWRSAARTLNCGLVFVPEINSDLAKSLLSDISLGRGSSAAYDVCFVDDRVKVVKLIRPIRDLNELEVQHYIQLNDLEFVVEAGLYGSSCAPGASIQNLTNEFVKNLQKNYSSTITTVFRTGDKLDTKMNESDGQCRMCYSQLDTIGSETLYATELSRILSTNSGKEKSNGDVLHFNGQNELCHACLSISTDTSGAKEFIFAFNDC